MRLELLARLRRLLGRRGGGMVIRLGGSVMPGGSLFCARCRGGPSCPSMRGRRTAVRVRALASLVDRMGQ